MKIINTSINNIETIFIKTNKFKNFIIDIIFEGEFNERKATLKSLLQKLLMATTKKYPEKDRIVKKLFDLYDCSISASCIPSYKMISTVFTLDMINYNYVDDKSLFKEAILFFKEFIFNPNITEEEFVHKYFDEEKKLLRKEMEKIYDNKGRYAVRKMLETMCKDEIVSIPTGGTIKELETITSQDLYNEYIEMMTKENVRFVVMGDFEIFELNEYLKLLGSFQQHDNDYQSYDTNEIEVDKVREVIETQKINQSRLVMGYRTNIDIMHPLKDASILFSMMFGGIFVSDLVRIVREELSLAYSVASTIFPINKLMIVTAGIDAKNYHQVTDVIIKRLEEYRSGKVDEDLLETAKQLIISDYVQIEDNPNEMMDYYYRQKLYGTSEDHNKRIESFKAVKIEDIIKVSKLVTLDTIFLLRGDE